MLTRIPCPVQWYHWYPPVVPEVIPAWSSSLISVKVFPSSSAGRGNSVAQPAASEHWM